MSQREKGVTFIYQLLSDPTMPFQFYLNQLLSNPTMPFHINVKQPIPRSSSTATIQSHDPPPCQSVAVYSTIERVHDIWPPGLRSRSTRGLTHSEKPHCESRLAPRPARRRQLRRGCLSTFKSDEHIAVLYRPCVAACREGPFRAHGGGGHVPPAAF